jgi:hypothetical protein
LSRSPDVMASPNGRAPGVSWCYATKSCECLLKICLPISQEKNPDSQ